jgi:heptosyltransferase-1
MPRRLADMKRVLIIRLSAIGDVIMASSLIPPLRRTWPDAYIAWLVEPGAQDLLRHNPRLNEIILWPKAEWQRLWHQHRYGTLLRHIRNFTKELRARRFNLVLDTQGLLKSGLLAALSGAPERIGLGSKEGSQGLMTLVIQRQSADRRIASEYLKLAQVLELETGTFPMDIVIAAEDAEHARRQMRLLAVSESYAVICPFTTRPQKHWFEDRWVRLSRLLGEQLNLPVIMLGGPGDIGAAARIAGTAEAVLFNLAGKTTLGQAAALIQGARLLIGVDTGLTHLGIALDIPTLALFGSTRPYLDPATDRADILYRVLPCSPCRRRPTCNDDYTCMKLHTAESVLASARQLLARCS